MKAAFVGLSGGVDSAVSAALLKQQGYRVVGAFIKIWRPEFIDCPWQRDRLDAMRVCAALEIPFKEIDLSDEYKNAVIDDMVSKYERGITPNPDVLCNRHIKFGAFSKWAYGNGADYVATGHYAQNIDGHIMRGKDTNKDQSYFLWQLTKGDLERVLFPVGRFIKREVRSIAEKLALPVAKKKDSQGLCFVGDITLRDFLSHYIALEKGDVLDENGAVIGEHDGAALYTLGERRGFRIHPKRANTVPHFVIAIDTAENTLTVSPNRMRARRALVRIEEASWVRAEPSSGAHLVAQMRYRETPVACVYKDGTVTLSEPRLAPPGQSLVLYDGEKLIGGGIVSAYNG